MLKNRSDILYFLLLLIWLAGWFSLSGMHADLDEAGTYFVIHTNFLDMLKRVTAIQGQSPLAYVPFWAAYRVFPSEAGLRMPCLFFSLAAAFGIYRLGSKLFKREVGLTSALILLYLTNFFTLSLFARPYLLAICFLVWCVYALLELLRTGSMKWGIWCGLFAGLVVHSHFLFALGLVPIAAACLFFNRASLRRSVRPLGAAFVVCTLVVLPIGAQLSSLLARGRTLGFLAWPSLFQYARWVISWQVLVPLMVFLGISLVRGQKLNLPFRKEAFLFVLFWFFIPIPLLLAVSCLTGQPILLERYFSWQLPACALVFAILVENLPWKGVIIAAVALSGYLFQFRELSLASSYRKQAVTRVSALHSDCTIFYVSGFIEAQQVKNLTDPLLRAFLVSPYTMYGAAETIPLPLRFNRDELHVYFQNEWEKAERKNCVVMSYPLTFKNLSSNETVGEFLNARGYREQSLERFGGQAVERWERG